MGILKKIPLSVWLVLLVAILCALLYESNRKASEYRERADVFENTITDLHQTIRETEVRLNDSTTVYQAEVRSLTYSYDNLKAQYGELLKASGTRPKDVRGVTAIASTLSGKDTVSAVTDTLGNLKATVSDDYVKIDVEVTSEDSGRQAIIDYEVRDSLAVFNIFQQRRYLFGLIKKVKFTGTRVINYNPKVKITGLQTIDIIE